MIAAIGIMVWEGVMQVGEHIDRWRAYEGARAMADQTGLPLLNIGCPRRYPGKYPCADVCLDISEWRLAVCQSEQPTQGDVRAIPFPDGYFGAALCSHVLEHLASVADAEQALSELARVSDGRVFLAEPSRWSIMAWLHPEHRLWVEGTMAGDMLVEQRV